MHLFRIYLPGNRLKYPQECTIVKVVFLNSSRSPCPGSS